MTKNQVNLQLAISQLDQQQPQPAELSEMVLVL